MLKIVFCCWRFKLILRPSLFIKKGSFILIFVDILLSKRNTGEYSWDFCPFKWIVMFCYLPIVTLDIHLASINPMLFPFLLNKASATGFTPTFVIASPKANPRGPSFVSMMYPSNLADHVPKMAVPRILKKTRKRFPYDVLYHLQFHRTGKRKSELFTGHAINLDLTTRQKRKNYREN